MSAHLDQKNKKILTITFKMMSSLVHVGLNNERKNKRRGRGLGRERVSVNRRRIQMTGTTAVVSMRHSSRLENCNKDGNKKMHIVVEGNENSVPPRSPARGKKEMHALHKRDSSASVETEEEEDNSSFGGGLRNENTNEKGAVGSTQQNQSEEKKSVQHEKGNDEDEDDIETKPLSAFEQKLKNKKPISTDPKTFDPDTVLKIDEDFSKKAMSLGYELGTIKHSAYALLAMAGPGGMTVANIVSIAKRLDLYNPGTCKTPNGSVTAALSQGAHFQRVAPGRYALKEHVPDELRGGDVWHPKTKETERDDVSVIDVVRSGQLRPSFRCY